VLNKFELFLHTYVQNVLILDPIPLFRIPEYFILARQGLMENTHFHMINIQVSALPEKTYAYAIIDKCSTEGIIQTHRSREATYIRCFCINYNKYFCYFVKYEKIHFFVVVIYVRYTGYVIIP